MSTQNTNDSTEHTHRVIANNKVIYEGGDWAQKLLEAGMNPEYREITLIGPDGKPGTQLQPSLAPEALRERRQTLPS